MGAAAPKPPLAIPPHSKLWGFLAFSHESKRADQPPDHALPIDQPDYSDYLDKLC